MRALSRLFKDSPVGLVDIGASGGLEARWRAASDLLRCCLFEPDERSYQKMIENKRPQDAVFPCVLHDKSGPLTFNLCRGQQTSSIFAPNRTLVDRFPEAERFDVVKAITMPARTLDECLAEAAFDVDFVKLDTQGSELCILRGSEQTLAGPVIGLEIEVEFQPLYHGQCLFGDVSAFLAARGYEFLDFASINRWERTEYTKFGQLIFADALFLAQPEAFAETLRQLPPDRAKHKAMAYLLVCLIYRRLDLARAGRAHYSSYLTEHEGAAFDRVLHQHGRQRQVLWFLLRVANRLLRGYGVTLFPMTS